jgi:16S rRNA (adenine1518-N6/adenine1519-N6)-dimethyltransferase
MQAKKRYGQNFLINEGVINKIVTSVLASSDDLIIEIGPGRGALTKRLKEKLSYLVAYEIDTDMHMYLDDIVSDKVRIKYQDILKSDLKGDIKNIKYNDLYLVGNLPYYITTPILEYITKLNLGFKSFTIMVQKEVGNRFMAKPGSREYGYFTLFLQHYYDIEKVCDVKRGSFNPAPNVDSVVIQLTLKDNIAPVNEDEYFKFLKNIFKQKRKTLKNNLSKTDFMIIEPYLKEHNISQNIRAEELQEAVLIDLFKLIKS